jgi:hypothetical protein
MNVELRKSGREMNSAIKGRRSTGTGEEKCSASRFGCTIDHPVSALLLIFLSS